MDFVAGFCVVVGFFSFFEGEIMHVCLNVLVVFFPFFCFLFLFVHHF